MDAAFILVYSLCALLHGAQCTSQNETIPSTQADGSSGATTDSFESSSRMSTETPTSAYSTHSATPSPRPLRTTTTTAPTWMSYRKECLNLYFAIGGLFIVVTILLLSTLILSCKVLQLNRQIKMMKMSQDGELISNSDYWMGTARKNKGKPKIDSKETSMLMVTQEEVGSDDKQEHEEGQKVDKDTEALSKQTDESTTSEATEHEPIDTL